MFNVSFQYLISNGLSRFMTIFCFSFSVSWSVVIENVNVHEEEAIALEIGAVKEAENGNLSVAIEMLGRAIDLAPSRASGYNNRAQALRLKGDTKGKIFLILMFN